MQTFDLPVKIKRLVPRPREIILFPAIGHLAASILAREGKSLFAVHCALRDEKQTITGKYLHSLGAFAEVSYALSASTSLGPDAPPFYPPALFTEKVTHAR